jgi:hypothetical protein
VAGLFSSVFFFWGGDDAQPNAKLRRGRIISLKTRKPRPGSAEEGVLSHIDAMKDSIRAEAI